MDVTNEEQARIAEEAGACAVMALEMVPADIIKIGGIAKMADPSLIKRIQQAVTIPVMAKVRIGHFVEAQILEQLNVDFIDESEVLMPTDERNYIDKTAFKTPFVCGAYNLAGALKRIEEGAAMIRTKGRAGTGNVANAVSHTRMIHDEIEQICKMDKDGITCYSELNAINAHLLQETINLKRLPVVTFAAGGIATPADAALMMQLGVDGIFVGSGIFKSENPLAMAKAVVSATHNFKNPHILAEISQNLGYAMN